jgi:hypothetical protein
VRVSEEVAYAVRNGQNIELDATPQKYFILLKLQDSKEHLSPWIMKTKVAVILSGCGVQSWRRGELSSA